MAANWVRTLRMAGRSGEYNDDFSREYSIPYRVEFDGMDVSPGIAGTAPGIPVLYAEYNFGDDIDFGARAIRIHAEQDREAPRWWNVDVTFRTLSSDPAENIVAENPLERAPKIQVKRTIVEEVIVGVVDTANTDSPEDDTFIAGPMKNSAGEPFDPPPTYERTLVSIVVTKNMPFFEPDWLTLNDCVNSSVFLGKPPRTIKLSIDDSEREFENGYAFWPVTFEFRYRKETWDRRTLDQGTYYFEGDEKQTFETSDGASRVGNLDGDGGKLAADADPVFLRDRVYPEYDFNALGLGNIFT